MKRREFICMAASAALLPSAAAASIPELIVHKDPHCGCCEAWASAFGDAGFSVVIRNEDDMDAVKAKLKIPGSIYGCHTATVNGYFLEGHVPLEAAQRLLSEKPALAGLAVAGMPRGSLGMGIDPGASYDVIAVPNNGGAPYVYLAVRPK
ncbi:MULTISPECIES: DUF411 domain-containing protein [Agrobacterium]|uniref:DUF411 domain-containing protein n=1 Tax=Agrobacterium TaxID=357 RepID=UPI001571D1D9|nr:MULTISPECIES: DUF411 domain-containing protein [Agrobacterium]NTJ44131.1 DUF411 domain-containing protein [Agrobacterium larrymoorei]WCK22416.1 DUF411 domain-containing protein [Agrobacterium tumefaciens]